MTEFFQIPSVGAIAFADNGCCSLNITNECTLRCNNCPRSEQHPLFLQNEPAASDIIHMLEQKQDCSYMAFNGIGEATMRLDILIPVARYLKQRGSYIHLYTDGLANLHHNRDVLTELKDYVDEVTVSMLSQNASVYDQLCRPRRQYAYEYMLNFIQQARKKKFNVNAFVDKTLPGVDLEQCSQLGRALGIGLTEQRSACF